MAIMPFQRGADAVEVDFSQRHVVCPAHLAPFRERWPMGWEVFATRIAKLALDSPALQAGLGDPAFWKSTALYWEALRTNLGPGRVRALLEDRPACEWVEPVRLLEAYLLSGIGVSALCNLCGRVRSGAPYPMKSGQNYAVLPHVCFRCVVLRRI